MKLSLKQNWLEEYSCDESLEILTDFAWSHVKESGPFRDILGRMVRNRDWAGLCDFELVYEPTHNPLHLGHARQALAFFQKLEGLPLGVDKEQVALGKFIESENACRDTNTLLKQVRKGLASLPPFVSSVIFTAQRKIAHVLGDVPNLAELAFRFGPGATTTTKKRVANWAYKLISEPACSSNFAPFANAMAQQAPHWFMLHSFACDQERAYVDIKVDEGILQFVPKNAKTYRSIIVEPNLNSFFQLGVGGYIRKRLMHVGVDLDDQSRNQALAKSGSMFDSLATVDLSSASDTISRELVYELLPLDWARFLESGRTSRVVYKQGSSKERHFHLEKFSSMGNGFTFELETLIFWGLAISTLECMGLPTGWLAVYGDDIVLPSEAVSSLKQVFTSVGFSLNEKKSFARGPFRESCGADYFKGSDIRPFYQKGNVSGETLYVLHNFYMRQLDLARAKKVRRYIPQSLLVFGPDGYGDGHLVGSWTPITRKRDLSRGLEVVRFETFRRRVRRLKRVPDTQWALPTYSIYVGQGGEQSYDPKVVPDTLGYERIQICTHAQSVYRRA